MIDWFSFRSTDIFGELGVGFYLLRQTVIETIWMKIFPCDNPRSRRSSYVNIFGGC